MPPILSQIPQPLPEDDRIFTKEAVRLSLIAVLCVLMTVGSFKAGEYYGRKDALEPQRVIVCDSASQYDIYNRYACR